MEATGDAALLLLLKTNPSLESNDSSGRAASVSTGAVRGTCFTGGEAAEPEGLLNLFFVLVEVGG